MPWGRGCGRGRGYRWRYYATGVPGWAAFGQSGMGRGRGRGMGWRAMQGGNCDFYPWLPRGWWSGSFGPVTMTPQGSSLASQAQSVQPGQPFQQGQSVQAPAPLQSSQELALLKQEKQALEEDLEAIKDDLKSLDERMKELKSKSK